MLTSLRFITALTVTATVTAVAGPAPTQAASPPPLATLYSFPATPSGPGSVGSSALTLGGDGYLYGTTYAGGTNDTGNVDRIKTDGTGFQDLHDFGLPSAFGSGSNADGASPLAGLALSGGSLYGTTSRGGANGNGNVYRVNTDGTGFQVLHNFSASDSRSHNTEGRYPTTLTLSGGSLYGTANAGGANGSGTVYKLTPDGQTFTVLYTFAAFGSANQNSGGGLPQDALTLSGGYLYGTASGGGADGNGTIYRVKTDGTGFQDLHDFGGTDPNTGKADAAEPEAGLTLSGNYFYGTTAGGGVNGNGAVYRIGTDGTAYQVLHDFGAEDPNNFTNADGAYPNAPLTLNGGFLYGAAAGGGANSNGVIFALSPDGQTFQDLHDFSAEDGNRNNSDGSGPDTGLAVNGGTLYGATSRGGANGTGTVFSLSLPAPTAHLLWTNTDGKAALWNVDSAGSVAAVYGFGPYSENGSLWTATALATGPDGVSHLVWNNPDGNVALWAVQINGAISAVSGFGPYADGGSLWSAAGVSVGPDNVIHLLWTNPNHKAAFWNVTQGGSASVLAGYGPYADGSSPWDAVGVSTGPDNVSHLLWSNPDGHDAFWDVSDTDGSSGSVTGYGPYTDGGSLWGVVGVSTGPDNVSHLLWSNPDGKAAFWDVSDVNGSVGTVTGYGPYTDGSSLWSVTGLATGPDGLSHLLWDNTDGKAALWTLGASGSIGSVSGFGPYTDGSAQNVWSAVAVSAGP